MKVRFNTDQLAAVAAVVDSGSFDRAGRALHVSTSAVSQRIKALESATGQVLVRRASPCTPTPAGATVLRYARQIALLEAELGSELAADGTGPETPGVPGPLAGIDLPVAVNADSLATWFPHVFTEAAGWSGVRLQVLVEDEGHTADLLRDGAVLAAVSTDATPVAGCRCTSIARMAYRPYVARALLDAAGGGEGVDLATLPVVRFDTKDDLQDRALRRAGVDATPAGPHIPDSGAFVAAVVAGLGWGMLPAAQIPPGDRLVPVPGLAPIVRELYWHRWKLDSPVLDRLTRAVAAAAARAEAG